jgi:hypothetical protein
MNLLTSGREGQLAVSICGLLLINFEPRLAGTSRGRVCGRAGLRHHDVEVLFYSLVSISCVDRSRYVTHARMVDWAVLLKHIISDRYTFVAWLYLQLCNKVFVSERLKGGCKASLPLNPTVDPAETEAVLVWPAVF